MASNRAGVKWNRLAHFEKGLDGAGQPVGVPGVAEQSDFKVDGPVGQSGMNEDPAVFA